MTRKQLCLLAVVVLFALALGTLAAVHPLLRFSGVLSPEKQQLFRSAMNCQLVESWKIDFEGTHAPYTIEERRCTTREQLKRAPSAAALLRDERGWGLDMLDFILVQRRGLFRNTVVAGWDCGGKCPVPTFLSFGGRPLLLLTTVPAGSGSYDQWCFLGWMGDYIGCWHIPDEVQYAEQRYVASGEMLHALHPAVIGDRIVFSGAVGGPEDSNCCPTRGDLHIVLAPGEGDFLVEKVYRTPQRTQR